MLFKAHTAVCVQAYFAPSLPALYLQDKALLFILLCALLLLFYTTYTWCYFYADSLFHLFLP